MAVLGKATVDLIVNSAAFKTALKEAVGETRNFSREMKSVGGEARGSLALISEEVGVHLPRHLRTFIAQLPGVGQALSAAFSTVAIVGLGMVAFETAKKVYEAFKRAEEAPTALREAFEKLNEPLRLSNDELAVTNDKLEATIAKLEHRPVKNQAAQVLDEARVAADKLAESAAKAAKNVQEAIDKNGVGMFWGGVTGQTATNNEDGPWGNLQEIIGRFRREQASIAAAGRNALHGPGATPESSVSIQRSTAAALRASYGQELNTLNEKIKAIEAEARKYGGNVGGNQAAYSMLTGERAGVLGELEKLNQGKENLRLKDREQADRDANEAAKAATEAQRKAAEEQMRDFESAFKAFKAEKARTLEDDAQFWIGLEQRAQQYPQNLRAVIDKANEYIGELQQKVKAETDKFNEDLRRFYAESENERNRENTRELEAHGKAVEKKIGPVARRAEANQQQAAGRVFGATWQRQDLEQQLEEIERIKDALGDTEEIERAIRDIKREQLMVDAQESLASGTALGGIRSVFQEMRANSKTLGQELHDVVGGAINGISQNLAALATGAKTSLASRSCSNPSRRSSPTRASRKCSTACSACWATLGAAAEYSAQSSAAGAPRAAPSIRAAPTSPESAA